MVSGPLWTGPLHNAHHLTEMMSLAELWGWLGDGEGQNLEKLLKLMIDESDPKLPVGYLNADEVLAKQFFFIYYFLIDLDNMPKCLESSSGCNFRITLVIDCF